MDPVFPNGNSKKEYVLTDKSGTFSVEKMGVVKKNQLIVKNMIKDRKSKIVEKSISFSTIGSLKNLNLTRPTKSEYTIYFSGKKYVSRTHIDLEKRDLVISLRGVDKVWEGERRFKMPKNKNAFCYFSQVLECINATGLIRKSIEKKVGRMNFQLIFDGYPYIQETYPSLPNTPITSARFSYDGKLNKKGEIRFLLEFSNQALAYIVGKNFELKKIFWVNEGYSLVSSDLP